MTPIATVRKSNGGPYLLIAGEEVFSWLGTMHNEEADGIAAKINAAAQRLAAAEREGEAPAPSPLGGSATQSVDEILAGPDYDAMENTGVRESKLADLARRLQRELAAVKKGVIERFIEDALAARPRNRRTEPYNLGMYDARFGGKRDYTQYADIMEYLAGRHDGALFEAAIKLQKETTASTTPKKDGKFPLSYVGITPRTPLTGETPWTDEAKARLNLVLFGKNDEPLAWIRADGLLIATKAEADNQPGYAVYPLYAKPGKGVFQSSVAPNEELKFALLARNQFEGDPEGALTEMECRVRKAMLSTPPTTPQKPLDMLLFCPRCDLQHVDAPKGDWTNPPHATHTCQGCGLLWRPSNGLTNGVEFIYCAEQKHFERAEACFPKHYTASASVSAPCIYEARSRDGEARGSSSEAWCRVHGFDCPNAKPAREALDFFAAQTFFDTVNAMLSVARGRFTALDEEPAASPSTERPTCEEGEKVKAMVLLLNAIALSDDQQSRNANADMLANDIFHLAVELRLARLAEIVPPDAASAWNAALEVAAKEVASHWNHSETEVNQQAQAQRSAAAILRMKRSI